MARWHRNDEVDAHTRRKDEHVSQHARWREVRDQRKRDREEMEREHGKGLQGNIKLPMPKLADHKIDEVEPQPPEPPDAYEAEEITEPTVVQTMNGPALLLPGTVLMTRPDGSRFGVQPVDLEQDWTPADDDA